MRTREIMACKLTRFQPPPPHFTAPAGAVVTLGISGTAAVIHPVIYDGQPPKDPAKPTTFEVGHGDKVLVVVVGNLPGSETNILEMCNGGSQVLKTFDFDPSGPAVGLVIRGT